MYLDDLKKKEEGGAVVASQTKDIPDGFSPSCSADDRTRHFLKVQDGCDYFCSYCTIPFARGRSRNGTIRQYGGAGTGGSCQRWKRNRADRSQYRRLRQSRRARLSST